jgi:hypothetical protein
MRFHDLDKSQLTYASDTLLHFALYAATFLWSLCRTPDLYDFGPAEVEYTRDIILKVADTLDSASVYPGSSPGLHAKHLRRLCRSGGSGSDAASSGSDSQQFGHGRNQSYSETERTPIDLPRSPMGNSAHGVPLGLGSGRSNSPGHLGHGGPPGELDYLLSDFQWAGIDLPWGALEPAHIMGAAGGPPPPPPRRAPSPRPLTTPTNGRYPGHHAGNVA